MPQSSQLRGHPLFPSAEVRATQFRDGVLAAWQQQLDCTDPLAALAEVGGDFAIDLPLRDGRRLLAVDRFAQQTLCWARVGGELHSAARADTLAKPLGSGLEVQALFSYLYFHCIPSPATVWQGVFRLTAGHAILGNGEPQRYWQAAFQVDPAPQFDRLREEFRHILAQAVSAQRDDGPAACFLSGGTDSSTVAGFLAQQAPGCMAFSIGFSADGYDEMSYARIAAQAYGCQHHAYYVTPKDLHSTLAQVAAHHDQPFGNSSALPSYFCARMAQEHGVTRLLAGDGGDELFGGNARYATQRLFGHYAHVPRWLKRGLIEPIFDSPWVRATPLLKKGSSYITQARAGMPGRLEQYNLLVRLGLAEVLAPQFLVHVDAQGPQAHQQATWAANAAGDELNTNLAFDWRYTLAENDLVKVRGAGEMAGVTIGFPLLDNALLSFSQRLPLDYKLRGQKLRWFFKEALRGFLPDAILTKSKHGFGLPFGPWLAGDPLLQQMARDTLHSLAGRGLLRTEFIDRLLREYLPAHPGYYGEMVWIALSMELWLQAHAPGFKLPA